MLISVDGIKYQLVDLESLFIISPRFEENYYSYIKPVSDSIFIDVGVHIGKYALKAAKEMNGTGIVVALEVDPYTYQALVIGMKSNKLDDIIPIAAAANNKEGIIELYVSPPEGKNNKNELIGKGLTSIKRPTETKLYVQSITLDKLVSKLKLNKITSIKVDVEGAEYEVLKGSNYILKNYKPNLLIEVTENKENVFEYLKTLGYEVSEIGSAYYYCSVKNNSSE